MQQSLKVLKPDVYFMDILQYPSSNRAREEL